MSSGNKPLENFKNQVQNYFEIVENKKRHLKLNYQFKKQYMVFGMVV
jgi:hypothetical protein